MSGGILTGRLGERYFIDSANNCTGPCYTDTRGALCTGALEGVVCTKQLCCATVGVAWGHPCERCGDLSCPTGHLKNLATKECQVWAHSKYYFFFFSSVMVS